MKQTNYDIAVIGAGIIGLATAMQLTDKYPSSRVVVLDKEKAIAEHQTGHNSGVIHAGIYYKPGSAKASFCFIRFGNGFRKVVCSRFKVSITSAA